MNLEQNYNYYQPWSDNEWLIQELINDNIITIGDDEINDGNQ